MTAPNEIIQSAAPIEVLYRRLEFHNAVGRRLEGLNMKFVPEWDLEGQKDLPNIRVIDYVDREEIFAGAGPIPTNKDNANMAPTCTLVILLSVNRKHGLFNRNGSTGEPKDRGLLEWVTYIRDAMEVSETGQKDSLWKGTCCRPFTTRVLDNIVRDLSWSCGIEVTFYPRELIRGTRTDLMSVV